MLTRIIARVAVPFFFMTSGFFLISRYTCNAEKLGAFIKKTTLIYGVAILLYIPINVYNGYFKMDNLLPNIIKDIVFDGTLYHLWYLPASIIGAAIAWYLVKKVHYRKAFLIASVLYIIGLFGDSYYGIVKSVSCLNVFYNLIFQLTDYTRNGIFFAPIFFVLGGYISDNQNRLSLKRSIVGFIVCFALMFGEALTLHHFDIQKHDSMYVLLFPSVYPELECDYIRVGVALYGVLSSTNDKAKLEIDLRPVLSLKAKVVLIRKIKQGESVGYSRAFTATRDSLIAILPIGYADGFPRNLSCGNSYALIGGRQAPIVGKICMDQLAVDVTDIPNVKTGSIATLIGKDGKEEITAPMVAESAESITNELLSRMGHRLNIIRRA